MSTQHDPAASWRRHTPRQAAQAAARFDREAREAIAAHAERATEEAIERAIHRALQLIEKLGVVVLTGTVSGKGTSRPVTREELAVCKDTVRDGWKTLKRYAGERVTVLS